MAFFTLAALGTGAWLLAGQSHNYVQQQRKRAQMMEVDPTQSEDDCPYQGEWGHVKDYIHADTRGMFKSLQQTRDVHGADIFLVDYGNGQKVVQYHDPRLLY